MQRLEVSGSLRPIYGSLGVKRLIYILNRVFHCTVGCSSILTFIVNDMGSHTVHSYVVPCICSALA